MASTECPKCGNKVNDTMRICPVCGEVLPVLDKSIVHKISVPKSEALKANNIGPIAPKPAPKTETPTTPAAPKTPAAPAKPAAKPSAPKPATAPAAPVASPKPAAKAPAAVKAAAAPAKKRTWLWVTIAAVAALVFVGGGTGLWYYNRVYLPEKIDREAPRTFPMVNVQLRSSKMAGGDFNKLMTVPFGGELITYESDDEWAKVKYVSPDAETKTEGYVAAPYLLDRKDFYILNSLFGDNDVREIIATAKVRRALLDYFKEKGYVGKLSADLMAEVGLSAGSDNQWQVIFHHGKEKPNEVLFKRLYNKQSKFTDMAVLIENINSHERKMLYFRFDDDETPHLEFEGYAPVEGDIKDIEIRRSNYQGLWEPNDYRVTFTNGTRDYTGRR